MKGLCSMKHVIVFSYIFTLLLGVSALTIQWLAGKGDKDKHFDAMKAFILMLLVMNVYDFFIYYCDNIINQPSGNILLSIGDCLIAVLVLLWLKVQVDICGNDSCGWTVRLGRIFIIVYMVIWLAAVIFFLEIKWIRLIIDVPLIGLLLIGSWSCIHSGIKNNEPRKISVYKGIITFFMAVNYMSYFISESGVIRESNEHIMDLTIFYWLVINIANILMLYKNKFYQSYLVEAPTAVTLDEALDAVKERCDLTKREVEILREIYSGKTNTQIAETLFISESTVKAHIYNIFRKMNVKSRVEAACVVRDEKEK